MVEWGRRTGSRRNVAAGRPRGRLDAAAHPRHLPLARPPGRAVARRRGRARPADAVAAGRVRRRHRGLLHGRARAGLVGRGGAGGGARRCRGRGAPAAASRSRSCSDAPRSPPGFATATLRTLRARPPGAARARLQRHPVRLRREPRGARARPTASWCACTRSTRRASTASSSACACRSRSAPRRRSAATSRCRRGSRRRCSRCGRAATTSPATSISSGIGASGFAAGTHQACSRRPSRAACGCASRASSKASATAIDARIRATIPGDAGAIASALITGKRDALTPPGQRRDVHLEHRPRAVDLRLSHGGGRRRRVLRGAGAARAGAGAGAAPSDQEMGGARRAGRGGALSPAVGRRGRDPALLHHDGDRADRRDGRPAAADLAHACRSRRSRCCMLAPEAVVHPSFQMSFAATLALVAALPARPAVDGGRRRHAARARASRCGACARSWRWCSPRWSPGSRPRPMRPTISTGSRLTACWPTCSPCRSSPLGDAGRPARPAGAAVRVRRAVLAADGRGHRLDDRGRAVGREPAGRGRPHGGVRARRARCSAPPGC